jgi:hypothetical protein
MLALGSALLFGVSYSFSLAVQLGYLFPALVKWLKRPFWALLLTWVYGNWGYLQYLISSGSFFELQSFQYILLGVPFLYLMACWVLLDDSLELVVGLMLGASLLNNFIIKLGNAVGIAGKNLVVIFLEEEKFDYWIESVTRLSLMLLITLYLYRKIPWKDGRSRIFSKYQQPTKHDEWQNRIDEIGSG